MAMLFTNGHPLSTQLHTHHCLVPPGRPPLQQSLVFGFPHPRSPGLVFRQHWRTIPPVGMPTPHHLLPQSHARTRPGGLPRRHPPSHIRAGGSIATRDMNGHCRWILHVLRQCLLRDGFLRRGRIDCPTPHSHGHTRPTRNIGRGRPGVQLVQHVHRVAGHKG